MRGSQVPGVLTTPLNPAKATLVSPMAWMLETLLGMHASDVESEEPGSPTEHRSTMKCVSQRLIL